MSETTAKKWAFFGTSDFAVIILNELKMTNIIPSLVITTPDRPQGRKMILTPPPVKEWAAANSVPFLQPEKLKNEDFLNELGKEWKLFIVAAYGKIVPQNILDLPNFGSFNIHPSLLPKYRGSSPLQNQILINETALGTTLIKMDKDVDHGPIASQKKVTVSEWPVGFKKLEEVTAKKSAEMLKEIWPSLWSNNFHLTEQDHTRATFTTMLIKEDGLLNLADDPLKNYLKYLAYEEWPGTYFVAEKPEKSVRLKIREARFQNSQFIIDRVIPEGKKEMLYSDFLKGF